MHRSGWITPRFKNFKQSMCVHHKTIKQRLFLFPTLPIPGQVDDLIGNVALSHCISMHHCAVRESSSTNYHVCVIVLHRQDSCT